jgi:hypothetical protein
VSRSLGLVWVVVLGLACNHVDGPSGRVGALDAGGDGFSTSAPQFGSGTVATGPVADAVYTMSNAKAGNTILGFLRDSDGSLEPMATSFSTGGAGSGRSLGDQGGLAYDLSTNRIYAVNAGDDTFSYFTVQPNGSLGPATRVPPTAGLVRPKSVTFRGDSVYVLYEGDASTPSSIAGYDVAGGTAALVPGSRRTLSNSARSVDPAQIAFTPDGTALVVTEKQTGVGGSVSGQGSIDLVRIAPNGSTESIAFFSAAAPSTPDGAPATPYGFAFSGETLVVAEAGYDGIGAFTGGASRVAAIKGVTAFRPTDPAPCRVCVTGNLAYVANARGPSISGFVVAASGGLSPIGTEHHAVVATTGRAPRGDAGAIEGPTDLAASQDGRFLYVLDAMVPSIGVFAIGPTGALDRVGSADLTPPAAALPAGAVGLVAR